MDSKVILAIIFLFANTIGASTPKLVPYILNGTIADMGQFPYFARIEVIQNDNHARMCGGSIIYENWLITVKNCVKGEHEKINAYFGIVAVNEYESSAIIENDNIFTSDMGELALLKTSNPIEFSYNVQPIHLAKGFMLRGFLFKEKVEIAGMGYYKKDDPSDVLRYGTMRVLSFFELVKHEKCSKFWLDRSICLTSDDSYNMAYTGDAGDPVSMKIYGNKYLMAVINTRLEGENMNTAVTIQPYIPWMNSVTGIHDHSSGLNE